MNWSTSSFTWLPGQIASEYHIRLDCVVIKDSLYYVQAWWTAGKFAELQLRSVSGALSLVSLSAYLHVCAVPAPVGVDFQPRLETQTKPCSSLETPRQFQLTQLGFASSQQTERRYGCCQSRDSDWQIYSHVLLELCFTVSVKPVVISTFVFKSWGFFFFPSFTSHFFQRVFVLLWAECRCYIRILWLKCVGNILQRS